MHLHDIKVFFINFIRSQNKAIFMTGGYKKEKGHTLNGKSIYVIKAIKFIAIYSKIVNMTFHGNCDVNCITLILVKNYRIYQFDNEKVGH